MWGGVEEEYQYISIRRIMSPCEAGNETVKSEASCSHLAILFDEDLLRTTPVQVVRAVVLVFTSVVHLVSPSRPGDLIRRNNTVGTDADADELPVVTPP